MLVDFDILQKYVFLYVSRFSPFALYFAIINSLKTHNIMELWNIKKVQYLDISPAGRRRGFVTTGDKMHEMQKTQTVKFQARSHTNQISASIWPFIST